MNNLKISIPSISENIRIVESFIDNIKESYNINDDIYGNIMIAVTESVNNAIIHGNANNKNKSVDLQLVQEPRAMSGFPKIRATSGVWPQRTCRRSTASGSLRIERTGSLRRGGIR